MWANLHLLFWLSLLPFATGWLGENEFGSLPSAIYGSVLLMAAIAYYILQNLILAKATDSVLISAFRRDLKGKLSPALYVAGILSSFIRPWLAGCIYVLVALMWLIPDRRIERVFEATTS
jgi:uncharacterized membrane protein